jgi:hypothetical protein
VPSFVERLHVKTGALIDSKWPEVRVDGAFF